MNIESHVTGLLDNSTASELPLNKLHVQPATNVLTGGVAKTVLDASDSFVILNNPPKIHNTIKSPSSTPPSAHSSKTVPGIQSFRDQPLHSHEIHRGNLSHRLKVSSKLFDLVSGVSDVDHPLCHECADEMIVKLEKSVTSAKQERDTYTEYFKSLKDEESTKKEKEGSSSLMDGLFFKGFLNLSHKQDDVPNINEV